MKINATGQCVVSDGEKDSAIRENAYAVSVSSVGGVFVELGMDFAIDDEHRAGLGGEGGVMIAIEILVCSRDLGFTVLNEKDAIRLQVEISEGFLDLVDGAKFIAVFDVKAERCAVLHENPGVAQKLDFPAVGFQGCGQCVEFSDRCAVGVLPVNHQLTRFGGVGVESDSLIDDFPVFAGMRWVCKNDESKSKKAKKAR